MKQGAAAVGVLAVLLCLVGFRVHTKKATSSTSAVAATTGVKVFAQLSKGDAGGRVQLGILGHVYDVSSGEYYQKGGGYAFFAGTDGSKAFITGVSLHTHPINCSSFHTHSALLYRSLTRRDSRTMSVG